MAKGAPKAGIYLTQARTTVVFYTVAPLSNGRKEFFLLVSGQ